MSRLNSVGTSLKWLVDHPPSTQFWVGLNQITGGFQRDRPAPAMDKLLRAWPADEAQFTDKFERILLVVLDVGPLLVSIEEQAETQSRVNSCAQGNGRLFSQMHHVIEQAE